MNDQIKFFFPLATSLLAVTLILQPVLADTILPGRCHMGRCYDQKISSKTLLKSTANGNKLYAVEISLRSWKTGSQPPNDFKKSKTSYVYCSTKKPAYVIKNASNSYYAHLLNPGGEWFGYNQSDYPIYWLTCHNLTLSNYFAEDIKEKAMQFGYLGNLNSKQIEVKNFLDILE